MVFDIKKYLGLWYELVHYPSAFDRNDLYNITSEYTMDVSGNIIVTNRTIHNGLEFTSLGNATIVNASNIRLRDGTPALGALQVSFPSAETLKLEQGFNTVIATMPMISPNYVIDKVWLDASGNYAFAVVTDAQQSALHVLSRLAHPPLAYYNTIMNYISAHYDPNKFLQVPHFQ